MVQASPAMRQPPGDGGWGQGLLRQLPGVSVQSSACIQLQQQPHQHDVYVNTGSAVEFRDAARTTAMSPLPMPIAELVKPKRQRRTSPIAPSKLHADIVDVLASPGKKGPLRSRSGARRLGVADVFRQVSTWAERHLYWHLLPMFTKGSEVDFVRMTAEWNARVTSVLGSQDSEDAAKHVYLKGTKHLSQFMQEQRDAQSLQDMLASTAAASCLPASLGFQQQQDLGLVRPATESRDMGQLCEQQGALPQQQQQHLAQVTAPQQWGLQGLSPPSVWHVPHQGTARTGSLGDFEMLEAAVQHHRHGAQHQPSQRLVGLGQAGQMEPQLATLQQQQLGDLSVKWGPTPGFRLEQASQQEEHLQRLVGLGHMGQIQPQVATQMQQQRLGEMLVEGEHVQGSLQQAHVGEEGGRVAAMLRWGAKRQKIRLHSGQLHHVAPQACGGGTCTGGWKRHMRVAWKPGEMCCVQAVYGST